MVKNTEASIVEYAMPKAYFAEVSGTLNASDGVAFALYPTGFNNDNTYVIGFIVNNQFVRFTDNTSVYLTAGAINIYNIILDTIPIKVMNFKKKS